DGRSLIVTSLVQGVFVHDLEERKIVRQFDGVSQFLAISPDSKSLATIRKDAVVLHSLESGIEIRSWQVSDRFLSGNSGAFSPDGKILALPFECGIQLWDPASGKRLDRYLGSVHISEQLAVSDDSMTIAVLFGWHAGQFLQLFDVESLKEKG